MVSLGALWLPILLSAILVFVVSSILHMVFKYHAADYRRLPDEEAVRAALRPAGAAPGQYVTPHVMDMKELETPEVKQKFVEGPVAVMYVKPNGYTGMGPMLGQWFLFILLVSFFVAYLASHVLGPGTPYLDVFRVVGAAGFLAYGAGAVPNAIWMGKPWSVTTKELIDGLIYGLVTAGTFGWLWPG
jgi:uncharacterized membrane protein (DUF485 family)